MKITGGHQQPSGRRLLRNHHYRQLIVNTPEKIAVSAADSSRAFTMAWNQ